VFHDFFFGCVRYPGPPPPPPAVVTTKEITQEETEKAERVWAQCFFSLQSIS
jgi:hypothetical protein